MLIVRTSFLILGIRVGQVVLVLGQTNIWLVSSNTNRIWPNVLEKKCARRNKNPGCPECVSTTEVAYNADLPVPARAGGNPEAVRRRGEGAAEPGGSRRTIACSVPFHDH